LVAILSEFHMRLLISSSMHKITLALVYLACAGHGRRVPISIQQLQSGLDVTSQNPLERFASLLVLDSAIAFNTPGSLGRHIGRRRDAAVPLTTVTGKAFVRMQDSDEDMEVKVNKANTAPAPAPAPAPRQPPNVAEAAQTSIDNVLQMLSPDVEPPKSMLPLKEAISGGDTLVIGAALYDMLIEQTLDYDVTEEKKMVASTRDYSKTDDPLVKEKIGYVYTYGINMLKRGLIAEDAVRDIVVGKICSRVGMDGAELDQWLQIPAVV